MKTKKCPESKILYKIWVTERTQLTHPRIDLRALITRDSIINCYDIFHLYVYKLKKSKRLELHQHVILHNDEIVRLF